MKNEFDLQINHLDNYEGLGVKAVRAKAKTGFQSSFYMWENDEKLL